MRLQPSSSSCVKDCPFLLLMTCKTPSMTLPAMIGLIIICLLRNPVDLSTASTNLSSGWTACKAPASYASLILSWRLLIATKPAKLFVLIGSLTPVRRVIPVVTLEVMETPSSLTRKRLTRSAWMATLNSWHHVSITASKLTACNNLAFTASSCTSKIVSSLIVCVGYSSCLICLM